MRLCGERARRLWLGQGLSLLISATGVLSALLAERGISVPATQNALNYFLLAFYLAHAKLKGAPSRRSAAGGGGTPKVPLKNYLALAVLDVEANFLVVLAYRYTTVASVMLLDCFTIPSAMLLSKLFLGARYNRVHLAGVGVCLVGLGLTVVSDLLVNGPDERYPDAWKGDLCCLAGAFLYAASNVTEEFLVKSNAAKTELLGHLGALGFGLSAAQAALLESGRWAGLPWTPAAVACFAGFAATMFALYSCVTIFLGMADSALFNLSLLTSDVYAVIFTVFVSGKRLTPLYFVALATTSAGLLLYHTQEEPSSAERMRCIAGDGSMETRPLRMTEEAPANPLTAAADADAESRAFAESGA